MLGRKEIENVWKEEWELPLSNVKEINENIEIKLNDILIEFTTTRIKIWCDRYGTGKDYVVGYCAYIPYTNKVFTDVDFTDEYFDEDEGLLDRISMVRSDIEEAIEFYLRENGYLID